MANAQSDTLRLFYALWPDDATRTALMQLQYPMQGRKIPFQNLHITLAFLGFQPALLLPALRDVLMRLPKTSLTLTIDRVGYFNRNRIAWGGMHDVPDALLALQRNLMQALKQQGATIDRQSAFRPHVTLARDAPPPPDTAFAPIIWQARQAVLVESVTRSEGSEYRILASRSLEEEVWSPDERGSNGDAEQME